MQSQSLLRAMTIAIPRFNRKRLSILASTLSILLSSLILVLSWDCPALAQNDTASRIQTKISQVGANAIKLPRNPAPTCRQFRPQCNRSTELLRSGKVSDAEQILRFASDKSRNADDWDGAHGRAPAPAGGHTCDPRDP